MHCYSQYHAGKEECKNCPLLDYCKESTESMPSLLCNRTRKIPTDELPSPLPVNISRRKEERIYTRNDMLELIGIIVAMDDKTLAILEEKIHNPMISLAEIGRKKSITRQAIHKFIKSRCEQIPEIAAVFKCKNDKNKTFMEAVCQIKQKSSELNSKKQEPNSDFYRSLISLNRSLDLSRLSIGKDLNS